MVQRVVVEVQFGEIWQRVQCVASSVFNPPSDAGLWHGGLERGLGLPDSHVGAVPKRLDGVSCKGATRNRLEPVRTGAVWKMLPTLRQKIHSAPIPPQKKSMFYVLASESSANDPFLYKSDSKLLIADT